jgi:hypothetical protein
MTNSGKRIICALLNQTDIESVTTTTGVESQTFYGSDNKIFAITQPHTEYVTGGGTSIILSSSSETSDTAYVPTNIIPLNPQNATTTIASNGKLILTYVFTNTTSNTYTIRSVGLASKIDKSNMDWSVLILWNSVTERVVNPNDTFTFSIQIAPF